MGSMMLSIVRHSFRLFIFISLLLRFGFIDGLSGEMGEGSSQKKVLLLRDLRKIICLSK